MLCECQCTRNESKSDIEHGEESYGVISSEDLNKDKKLLKSIFNVLDILRGMVSFMSQVQVYSPISEILLESNVGQSSGREKYGLSDFYLVTVLIGKLDNISGPHVKNEWNDDGLGKTEGHNIVMRLEEQIDQIFTEISYLKHQKHILLPLGHGS